MKAKAYKPRERAVEKAIRDALTLAGYLVVKTDAGAGRRLSGGAARGFGDVPPGFPDLVALHPQKPALLVEVKKPGGRLNKRQRDMHAYLKALGFHVIVAHGVEDVEPLLKR